jgi:tRNA threonylcarbamoyladenosine biosynthesis protein TsaB
MSYNPCMLILAVDTSGPCGGAALLRDETVLAQCGGRSEEGYSSRIFRNVEEVLGVGRTRLAEVELFAVAAGPGSFTGLRVGLTAVKAWAEVWGRAIAPVDGLEAVAALATEPGEFVAPVIDARRGQVYAAIYRRGAGREAGLERIAEDVVLSPSEFLDWIEQGGGKSPLIATPSPEAMLALVSAAGNKRSLRLESVPDALAGMIGRLGWRKALRGETVDALHLSANYIRRSDAELNWKEPA